MRMINFLHPPEDLMKLILIELDWVGVRSAVQLPLLLTPHRLALGLSAG